MSMQRLACLDHVDSDTFIRLIIGRICVSNDKETYRNLINLLRQYNYI
jgi:hypothetical protein